MASNKVDPRTLLRAATRFKQLFVAQPKRKSDTNLGQYPGAVPLTVRAAYGQTADIVQIHDINGNVISRFDKLGCFGGLNVAHATYSFATDGGAQGAITPKLTAAVPLGAVIVQVAAHSPTAFAGTNATVAIGTTAGSSATALLAATAITSLGSNAVIAGVPILSDATKWVRMSAAGNVNVTVGTANVTAGILDIFVFYVMPN